MFVRCLPTNLTPPTSRINRRNDKTCRPKASIFEDPTYLILRHHFNYTSLLSYASSIPSLRFKSTRHTLHSSKSLQKGQAIASPVNLLLTMRGFIRPACYGGMVVIAISSSLPQIYFCIFSLPKHGSMPPFLVLVPILCTREQLATTVSTFHSPERILAFLHMR